MKNSMPRRKRSLRLDTREPNDLRPLVSLERDELDADQSAEALIAQDYAMLQAAGTDHPLMADILETNGKEYSDEPHTAK